jgi:hypothetical protein
MVVIREHEYSFKDDEKPRVWLPVELGRPAAMPTIAVATPEYITLEVPGDRRSDMVTLRVSGRKFITAEVIRHSAETFVVEAELA